jgi:hypothetical protein
MFITNVDMLSISEPMLGKLLELLCSKAHPHFIKVAIRHWKLIPPDSFIPTPSVHNTDITRFIYYYKSVTLLSVIITFIKRNIITLYYIIIIIIFIILYLGMLYAAFL